MVLRVAISERWSYAALNPDPGKQRGRGQEMARRRLAPERVESGAAGSSPSCAGFSIREQGDS
jgi:hypothetical protein